ncbi:MAG: helix-turn-helix domain-containing protein, partial [Deltaproteobacteria bacterium]
KHGEPTVPVSAEIIGEEGIFLDAEMDRLEKALLLKALDKTGGNRTEASKVLNISFRSMRYRLEKHGIE